MSLNCNPTRACREAASKTGHIVKLRRDQVMSNICVPTSACCKTIVPTRACCGDESQLGHVLNCVPTWACRKAMS